MEKTLSELLILQHSYFVASTYLLHIGNHPNHIKQGHIGYLMDLESIKEVVKSFNPEDWYKGEVCEGKEVTFDCLPTEDRWKVTELLNDLTTRSMSHDHLVEKCNKCMRLCLEFGDKILELKKEKDKLKKVTA